MKGSRTSLTNAGSTTADSGVASSGGAAASAAAPAGANSNMRQSSTMNAVADANALSGSLAQLSMMTNDSKKSQSTLRSSIKDHAHNAARKDPACSTQALFLLAEVRFDVCKSDAYNFSALQHLTELIDSISRSEDKEKLVPVLQSVWVSKWRALQQKKRPDRELCTS